jgi:hypothetical protein
MDTKMVTQTKQVMLSMALLEDCIRNAQVLIVEEGRWHVLAPKPYRMHCDSGFAPVPTVRCPVVDVRNVQDDEAMGRVMGTCVDPTFGVINLAGLLTGLEALGATVSRVPEPKALSATAQAPIRNSVIKRLPDGSESLHLAETREQRRRGKVRVQ